MNKESRNENMDYEKKELKIIQKITERLKQLDIDLYVINDSKDDKLLYRVR